ncbi:hypothetical protein [Actinomadura sp. 21ATH]|uniref:hypothetical protein n=1 Tax=Actinomadura sp. 21ATH TaxID=1735444 RepID=UPI0035BEB9B7
MQTFAAVSLAVFLIVVGIAHFVFPGYFRSLVPAWIRGPGTIVALSGAAEILTGGLVLVHRAAGGWAAAALITGYLASHLDALWRARADRPRMLERPAGTAGRLAVNLLYIAWALAVATG